MWWISASRELGSYRCSGVKHKCQDDGRPTSSRALVIEENPVTRKHIVRFTIVGDYPICIEFCYTCKINLTYSSSKMIYFISGIMQCINSLLFLLRAYSDISGCLAQPFDNLLLVNFWFLVLLPQLGSVTHSPLSGPPPGLDSRLSSSLYLPPCLNSKHHKP